MKADLCGSKPHKCKKPSQMTGFLAFLPRKTVQIAVELAFLQLWSRSVQVVVGRDRSRGAVVAKRRGSGGCPDRAGCEATGNVQWTFPPSEGYPSESGHPTIPTSAGQRQQGPRVNCLPFLGQEKWEASLCLEDRFTMRGFDGAPSNSTRKATGAPSSPNLSAPPRVP